MVSYQSSSFSGSGGRDLRGSGGGSESDGVSSTCYSFGGFLNSFRLDFFLVSFADGSPAGSSDGFAVGSIGGAPGGIS